MKEAHAFGIFSAADVSSVSSLPFAIVASTGTAYNIPGKLKSEEYCASPVTLRGPSMRCVSRPMGEVADDCSVVAMVAPDISLRLPCEVRASDSASQVRS
jgi:hypothetical protein